MKVNDDVSWMFDEELEVIDFAILFHFEKS